MNTYTKNLVRVATVTLLLVSVFIVVSVVKSFKSSNDVAQNTITVDGDSEVFATPDIASISFGASSTNKDLSTAQVEVEKNSSAAIDAVKNLGVDAKDIQTTYYNANPQYDYNAKDRPLIGYQVNQTTTVKIRDLSKVSMILGAIGTAKVSDISGPNFDIENKDALQEQAREEAIKKAKEKAEVLAKDLGVSLGKIVSYNDNNNSGGPIMYAKATMAMDSVSEVAPTIETGQNRIYSSVTIVYKIK